MAKATVKRADLLRFAKELGLELDPPQMGHLLDAAMDTDDPRAFVRGVAAEATAGVKDHESEPPADDNGEAAADRILEVLQGAPTDPAILPQPPVPSPETPSLGNIPTPFLVSLPPLAGVVCTGHRTKHVTGLQLTRNHLASETMTRLRKALHDQHAQLASGKHVEKPNDALLWLLEQYGKTCGLHQSPAPSSQPPAPHAQKENATQTG